MRALVPTRDAALERVLVLTACEIGHKLGLRADDRVSGNLSIVILALYGIAVVAMAFTGYAGGLERRPWRPAVYITGMLVVTVILLIQDIDRPNTGFITVSQQPMIDAANSLAGYSD